MEDSLQPGGVSGHVAVTAEDTMRKHLIYFYALVSFVLVFYPLVSASADESELPMVGDVTNGTHLYRVHCSVCHGFMGAGNGPAKVTLKKAPANLRDGSLMNSRDDSMLFSTIQQGCKGAGCSAAMPGFGSELGTLDVWDVLAYLRSIHVPLTSFFPRVDQYVVKRYHIGQLGNEDFQDGQKERLRKRIGKVKPEELIQTVFTLFKAPQHRRSPELVPQQPRRLAMLKKPNKLGFVLFMELQGPRNRKVPVGISLDVNYTITKLVTTMADPGVAGEYNKRLEKYVGMGKRGDDPRFKTGKDKMSKIFDKAVQHIYALAVEGANCFELEEKNRSWADGTF